MKNHRFSLLRRNLLIVVLIVFITNLSSIITYADATQTVDIEQHWAKSDILLAISEGWAFMNNQKFNPDKPATREEVIWMLVEACKIVQPDGFNTNKKGCLCSFKDRPTSWASDNMEIAIGNGIISGYPDGELKSTSRITRAEFAVIMSRLIDDTSSSSDIQLIGQIPKWALSGVKKAYAKGIIKGYPDNTFGSSKNVSKAEALVMIARFKSQQPAVSITCKSCSQDPLKDYPQEIKQIYKIMGEEKVAFGPEQLYFYAKDPNAKEADILLSVDTTQYRLILNNFHKETNAACKQILEIYFPTEYEKIFDKILLIQTTGEEETGNYNGRSLTVRKSVNEKQLLEINIGVK